MKKALFALIPALLFASCSFWNEPVEEFFSYWSSEAFITDSSVKVPNQSDKAGVPSVSSDTAAEIILKMSNPKSFRFIMPSAGNSEMIRFKGLETQPSAGTDYKLEQISSDTLKLTYSTQFLKKHEWGNGDLGATLTLFADDGRKFKKPYGFNLKANTPPPTPTAVLAQTAASSFSYVLCFKVPDMDVMVNGERLHKDIAQIEINGTKYPLTVESTDFRKPDDPHFILAGGVTQLTEPHSAPVPAGAWVLYYNTGVPLGAGHQEYTVKLKDDKDLVSKTLETGTTLNEPPAENVTVTAGEQSTGSGTDTDPFIIKGAASAPEAQIKIENTAAGTTVHCTVTEVGSAAPPARYDGNPVTFPLGLDSADEKTYKVEYYTDGIGYKSNSVKTKYYKVLKQHTVTFNANGGKYADNTTVNIVLVPHNHTATAPATQPTRTGYTFGAWYTDSSGTSVWNSATPITADTTIFAKWTPNTGTAYKVEHYQEETSGAGHYPASPADTENLFGTTGAAISVTQKNYAGFEVDRQEPASATIGAEGNTVVKVFYKRKTVTLTFNLNGGNIGGSMTAQTRSGRFGTTFTAPMNPVKTGYTFSSWQPVGASPALSSTFPVSDATYTAQWIQVYTVTFKVEGGSGGKLKGEYNGESKEASGTTRQEFANIPAGETVTFRTTASADYAVHSWTGVTASPPDSATTTLTVTANTEVTVKFYETTFDGSSHSAEAWKKLKELIAAAPAGGTLKISGTIQSTTAPGNNGEIIIDKDLTIEAPSVTATLDANESAFSTGEKKHRIFRVKDGKTLTLKNLTLKNGYAGKSTVDNLGTTGGGIRLESGTVSLSGVTISGCKAITTPASVGGGSWHGDGGGIYVVSGNIIMENTTLSENDANAHGGAVYMNGGTLTMKGSSVITPSTGGDANKTGKNDVHLKGGAKINVDAALTGTGTVARIGVAYNEYLPTRQVLDGTAVDSNNTKFTVTDQELGTDNHHNHVRKWTIKSDGYLQSEGVTLDGSKTRAWQALKDAVRTASDGDVIAINGTIRATNAGSGEYVDNGEIVIDKNLTIKKADGATSAILNANSNHSGPPPADAPAVKHRIFTVRVGSTLTLDNITLQGGMAEGSEQNKHGGGVYVDGKLIMKGSSKITGCSAAGEGGGLFLYGTCTLQDSSSITHCEAGDYGGGVFVDYSGTSILNINGGSITMNHTKKVPSSSGHGGGVYVRGNTSTKGKVYMTSGEISGNAAGLDGTAYKGDGGGVYTDGIFEMSGGVIKNNNAKNGGGVYTNGIFEMTGGTFSKNTATSNGGAIYSNSGTVTLNNATIGGTAADANKAADYGGGIYIDEGCSLTLKDGAKVIGNTAVSGGGVYNKGGSFEMTGGEIKSNTAKYGGGVYVKGDNARFTMSRGTIFANKAEKDSTDGRTGGDGGGVYIDGAKFTLKLGTTISNNTADKDGGGVTVFGGVFTMEGGDIQWNTVTGTSTVQNSGHAGGVDIVAAVMNMKGGGIKNNTAKNGGGGVSIALSGKSNSVLNMSGGTISGNTLTNSAGTGKGVEFFTGSTTHDITYYTIMKMSGSAKVDTNNDVYLTSKDDHSNEIRMITVDGELTGTAPVACITPKNYSAGLQVLDGSKVGTEHIKFTVTRGGSPAKNWYVGSNGKLTDDPAAIFNTISEDKIKAFEDNLKTITVEQYNNLKNRLIFYETNIGNYGVMLITDTQTIGADAYNLKFKYKTYSKDNGTIVSEAETIVKGTFAFDLDTGTESSSAAPLDDTKDFFLHNSIDIVPQNGAKFYVLP